MAAGRLQSSEHLSSLNSLAYKENSCIEPITMWNTVGREESLEQNGIRGEELEERLFYLLIFMDSAFKPLLREMDHVLGVAT